MQLFLRTVLTKLKSSDFYAIQPMAHFDPFYNVTASELWELFLDNIYRNSARLKVVFGMF